MKNDRLKVIVTCEHGGNEIPPEFKDAFKGAKQVLASHRGYDIGALELYQKFAQLADFSLYSTTSRLLVELNRSLHHPKLFSEFMLPLSTAEADKIVAAFYTPYRHQVEEQVARWVKEEFSVLHLSVHSFTPELNGKERKADIGLLYDPKREREQLFAARWRQQMQMVNPEVKIRYNYPYKGTADGFVTHLRKDYTDAQYAGLELEVNQRFPEAGSEEWQVLQTQLIKTFNLAI